MAIPRDYNAAEDLVGGNLKAGRAGKIAYVDDAGQCTFGELADRVNRFGSHLLSLGLRMEDRVLIAMHDSIDWPVAFLGAIKAGIVPVAVNTLLTPKDYEYMLSDSRAKAVVAALVAKGIDKSRLSSKGWGQDKPVADNAKEEGRARNRRVEIVKVR